MKAEAERRKLYFIVLKSVPKFRSSQCCSPQLVSTPIMQEICGLQSRECCRRLIQSFVWRWRARNCERTGDPSACAIQWRLACSSVYSSFWSSASSHHRWGLFQCRIWQDDTWTELGGTLTLGERTRKFVCRKASRPLAPELWEKYAGSPSETHRKGTPWRNSLRFISTSLCAISQLSNSIACLILRTVKDLSSVLYAAYILCYF